MTVNHARLLLVTLALALGASALRPAAAAEELTLLATVTRVVNLPMLVGLRLLERHARGDRGPGPGGDRVRAVLSGHRKERAGARRDGAVPAGIRGDGQEGDREREGPERRAARLARINGCGTCRVLAGFSRIREKREIP